MPTVEHPGDASQLDPARLLAVIALQSKIAASALDLDRVMGLVAEHASELTGADAGVVEIAEGDEMVYHAVSGTAEPHLGMRLRIETSLSGRAVREAAIQRCDDATADDRVDQAAARAVGALSMLCVPLRHGGGPVGVLKVYADRTHAFGDADVALLDSLSGVIGAHMAHAAEFERRYYESRHDALTDLGNRRSYDERLEKEVARAERYDHPLSLVLLDLDGFKGVNDEHGHPAGDDVLRAVGHVLRGVRRTDDCFRTGVDEFSLLLPDTPVDGAHVVASRVCEAIVGHAFDGGRVSASTGTAGWERGTTAAQVHAAADAALMDAKRRLRAGM